MSEEKKSKQKPTALWLWLLVFVAILQISGLIFGLGYDYFTGHFLNWDDHKQHLVLFSGMAVLAALGLLTWVLLADHGSLPPNENRCLTGRSILDSAGWSILLLALALSEAHTEWHVFREIYFGLGLLGGGLIIYSHVWRYRHATDKIDKIGGLMGILYLWLPIAIMWRYLSGAQGFF